MCASFIICHSDFSLPSSSLLSLFSSIFQILRAEKTQRLVLNAPIGFSGFNPTLTNEKYIRFHSIDLEGKLTTFLLKVRGGEREKAGGRGRVREDVCTFTYFFTHFSYLCLPLIFIPSFLLFFFSLKPRVNLWKSWVQLRRQWNS